VDRVRQQFDIVDIIGEYVRLKKSGRNYMGCCPFHNEKSPSFSVSQEKQLYHCFGCGASGNLFTFLRDKEGISFMEAVEQLARRANIALPVEEMEDVESPEFKRRKEMLRAHDLAAKYYHHILMDSEAGRPGLLYFESRGIARSTIETFALGHAPDRWDTLFNFLVRKRGFDPDLLVEAGLLTEHPNQKGRYFDKFRGRVMFPIHDGQGQVIGFGGRVLDKDMKPKYLNSPETPLFHKSRHLYNLHRARASMRRDSQVILLEGYMDVIAAAQNGVENVVAVLGTALTSDHMRLLQRNVKEIVMMFDGDAAGQKAALRSAEVVRDSDLTTRVAMLPDGLDPDEFLKKYGREAFLRAVVDQSSSMTTFRVLALRKDFNLSSEKGRDDYLRAVIQNVLVEVESPMELEKQLKELSEEFGYSIEAIEQELRMARKSKPAGDNPDRKWNTNRNNAERVSIGGNSAFPPHVKVERLLLSYMLIDDGVARQVQNTLADEFSVDEHVALAAHLYAFYAEEETADPETFIARLLDPDLVKIASSLVMETEAEIFDRRADLVVQPIIRSLQVHRLTVEAKRYEQQMIDCGNRGDLEGMGQANAEVKRIKSLISTLENANVTTTSF